jgi:hypothetical protein
MLPSQKVQHGVTSVEQCCKHWNIKIHEDKNHATISLVVIDRKLYKLTRVKMPRNVGWGKAQHRKYEKRWSSLRHFNAKLKLYVA